MVVVTNRNEIKIQINSKKMLVFDFDGVLADSVQTKTEAFAKLYQPYGPAIVAKVVEFHRSNGGMSRYQKFRYFHKAFLGRELDDGQLNRLCREFSNLVVEKVVSSVEIPGAAEFLMSVSNTGKICVVNSATPTEEVNLIVRRRGIGNFFADVYGSPATKVENLEAAIRKHSVIPSEVLFFGDAMADWEAACEANVSFIGVGREIADRVKIPGRSVNCIEDFRHLLV